ncbi:hypothetical protein GCM10010156_24170 [Planobispora rosea]|uniref:Uncharacterized protein n=1 Tax=Planobispora rosea TaxID=35762 RepID=A0A8J3RWV9_PLARO|nr:hypothetical protein GCM10010156_24170 [Planobispora rosea]GIH84581.1 hypothetical protein Pro02_29890 [Planobispora rosea]
MGEGRRGGDRAEDEGGEQRQGGREWGSLHGTPKATESTPRSRPPSPGDVPDAGTSPARGDFPEGRKGYRPTQASARW